MRKLFLLCAMSSLLLSFSGCSSGTSTGMQTVMAQTGYSNASLSGTYSVVWVNIGSPEKGNLNAYYGGTGTIQASGTGNITGGTLSFYTEGYAVPTAVVPCVYSVTGTYTLQSTALGTASLNLVSSTNGCTSSATWQIALAAGNGGTNIQLTRADGAVASGSAVKQ
jgi:hypothetical protein